MEAKDINTIQDMQYYVEGCINDLDAGISTKEETIKYFKEYTLRIAELYSNKGKYMSINDAIAIIKGLPPSQAIQKIKSFLTEKLETSIIDGDLIIKFIKKL
jgi:light-regulated signal transduction histidine kinase (bacteriophytochrome)